MLTMLFSLFLFAAEKSGDGDDKVQDIEDKDEEAS